MTPIVDLTNSQPEPPKPLREILLAALDAEVQRSADGYSSYQVLVDAAEANGHEHYEVWAEVDRMIGEGLLIEVVLGRLRRVTPVPYSLVPPLVNHRHKWVAVDVVMGHAGCGRTWECECGAGAKEETLEQAVKECVDDR